MINQDRVAEAKAAGFTEEEIAEVQGSLSNPNKEKARAAGFTDEEIATVENQIKLRNTDLSAAEFAKPGPQFGRGLSSTGLLVRKPDFEPSRDTIISLAERIGVDPTTTEGINAIYSEERRIHKEQAVGKIAEQTRTKALKDGLSTQEAEIKAEKAAKRYSDIFKEEIPDFVANLEELRNVDRPWEWFKSNFGDRANAEYEAIKSNNINAIQELAKERGLELQYSSEMGEWFAQGPDGKWEKATPSFLDSIGKSKYEIVGATIGGLSTVKLGKELSKKLPGLAGKLLGLGVVGAGTTAGAVIGDQVDYLSAAINVQEDLDAKVALEKAVGTAEFSAIGEVLGYGLFKLGAKSFKYVEQAYKYFKDGNTDGAYEALKQAVGNISDDEAKAIVLRWEKLNQMKAPGKNDKEKALAVVPTTQSGGESIIGATVAKDPTTSLSVSNEINSRASTLLKASKEAADTSSGKRVLDDLDNYIGTVKSFYDVTNEAGSAAVKPSYRFKLPKLGIRPLLEHKIATIGDTAKVDQLERILTRIDSATTSRAFPDLLDLYRTLNDFKFNKRLIKGPDKKAVNEALATVRSEIQKVTGATKKGTKWYADWELANKDYTKMKQLEKNVLFKSLTKPGVSEADIAKTLLKYSSAIDDTYSDVMAKLSPKAVRLTENSIVDQLVNKFTVGRVGEFRATDFPTLAEELGKYSFKTPEASRLKEVVSRMSEVYKNDVKMAASSGRIQLPGFQSYLTTDPVVRAKFEIASTIFNRIKSLVPGNQADTLAMVDKVAKLLENPLNAKTTKQVIEAVKDDQELVAMINKFQSEAAKSTTADTGALLFKDKTGKLFAEKAPGRIVTDTRVQSHRTIGQDDLLDRLGLDEYKSSVLTASVKSKLLKDGINAIELSDGQIILLDRK